MLAPDKTYEVALSFAGEDREAAVALAFSLQQVGVSVFYDEFERARLWGKDLVQYLGHVYRSGARYVVMFVSKHYRDKAWPSLERQAALARLLDETARESVLPVRIDDTEIPGLPPTIGYISAGMGTPAICNLLLQKLGRHADRDHPGVIGTSSPPSQFRFFEVSSERGFRSVRAKVKVGLEYQLQGFDALPTYFAERDYLLASNPFVQWQSRSFLQSFTACVAIIRIAKEYGDVVMGIAAGGRDWDPPQTYTQILQSPGLFEGLQEARVILGMPAFANPYEPS